MTATAGEDACTLDVDRFFPGDDKPAGDLYLSVSDQHADAFTRNEVALRVEQRLTPVVKYAAWVPVTAETLADHSPAIGHLVAGVFDRWLRPWRYPDRNPMPQFVALPRVANVARRVQSARQQVLDALQRLRDARHVLRHGLPERDDDW